MKLTRSMQRSINRKLRPNYMQENLLMAAFNAQVKKYLYDKIKKATSLEEVNKIIDEFNVDALVPAFNNLSNSVFSRSTKEFDLLISAFVKRPDSKYLNLRSRGLLYKREDFKPFLRAFKHNLSLIKDLPRDLASGLKQAYFTGTSFRGTAFAAELKARLGKRAKTIIRTESAKITSTLTQARMQKLGLNAILWSTSSDSRVRNSHAMLDGVLCFLNSPPVIDGFTALPGQTVHCRCVMIPITSIDDIVFPVKVAESLHLQTSYIRKKDRGNSSETSKVHIISGGINLYTKNQFIDKFGRL